MVAEAWKDNCHFQIAGNLPFIIVPDDPSKRFGQRTLMLNASSRSLSKSKSAYISSGISSCFFCIHLKASILSFALKVWVITVGRDHLLQLPGAPEKLLFPAPVPALDGFRDLFLLASSLKELHGHGSHLLLIQEQAHSVRI